MKGISALLCSAALVLGLCGVSAAVEIKVSGTWEVGFGRSENATFYARDYGGYTIKPFRAAQRVRPQFDFISSESLRSVLAFEIGTTIWGRDSDSSIGGALDSDGGSVKVRRAYLDWSPLENLTIRMGMQGVALPFAAFGNPVLDADVAGVVVNYDFAETVSGNLFWVRPFDSLSGESGKNRNDTMDVFGLTLPVAGEGFTVTPWAAYARNGNNSGYWDYISDYTGGFTLTDYTGPLEGSSNLWWVGSALEFDVFDPFSLKLDAMYGAARGNGAPEFSGWLAASLFEYKSGEAWGKPGLIGWYASGDKADAYGKGKYGKYGRMPLIGADNGGFAPAMLAYPGSYGCMVDTLISGSGVGSWGAGLQLADFGFVDKLTHTVRALYIRGTNHESMVTGGGAGLYGEPYNIQNDVLYMTRKDSAIELDFITTWEVNENVNVYLETAYVKLDLDRDVWGPLADTQNAWQVDLVFVYSF